MELADDLLLLDIYPARELPMEGVTSSIIFDKMEMGNKTLCTKSEVLDLLKIKQPELLVTVGAGDIDTLILLIREYFQWKLNTDYIGSSVLWFLQIFIYNFLFEKYNKNRMLHSRYCLLKELSFRFFISLTANFCLTHW